MDVLMQSRQWIYATWHYTVCLMAERKIHHLMHVDHIQITYYIIIILCICMCLKLFVTDVHEKHCISTFDLGFTYI